MRPPKFNLFRNALNHRIHPNVRLGTSKAGGWVSEAPSKRSGSLGPARQSAGEGGGRGCRQREVQYSTAIYTEMQHCEKIKFRTMCWETLDTSAQLS